MEPLGGVGVGIDAGVVCGERLHLIEAMLDRVGIGLVAEMPLARKVRRIAILLEEFRDGGRLLAQCILVARGHHDRERRADRNAPSHERGATGRAARLTVPAREHRAFLGDPVDVRGRVAEGRAASRIGTEIVPAGVIRHQHDDVGLLLRGCGRARHRHGDKQREQAEPDTSSYDHHLSPYSGPAPIWASVACAHTGRVFKGLKPRLICQFSVGKVLARMIGLGPVQVGFGSKAVVIAPQHRRPVFLGQRTYLSEELSRCRIQISLRPLRWPTSDQELSFKSRGASLFASRKFPVLFRVPSRSEFRAIRIRCATEHSELGRGRERNGEGEGLPLARKRPHHVLGREAAASRRRRQSNRNIHGDHRRRFGRTQDVGKPRQ